MNETRTRKPKQPDPFDTEGMMWDMVWSYALQYNQDAQELASVGRSAWARAAGTWNADKGRFTTWYWRCLRNALSTFVRRTDVPPAVELDRDALPSCHAEWQPDQALIWKETLALLGPDARLVADGILAGPSDGFGLRDRRRYTRRSYSTAIKNTLRREWPEARVQAAFNELRQAFA